MEFEQGDRKSQQDELEHGFELGGDFFWRKTKCVGAGISGGGHVGPMRQGACPGGRAHPGPSCPGGGSPWCVLSAKYS